MKINLGGGSKWREEGWENIDIRLGREALDALGCRGDCCSRSLPDGCAEIIYTSHCIEHIPFTLIGKLFADCHRVLRDGGLLHIVVPDVVRLREIWRDGDRNVLEDAGPLYYKHPSRQGRSLREDIKELLGFDEDGLVLFGETSMHRSFWDFETLALLLELAGFHGVHSVSYGVSSRAELCKLAQLNELDMPVSGFHNPRTKSVSLYVEAYR